MATCTAVGVIAPQLSGFYFGTLLASIGAALQPQQLRLLAFQGTPAELLASRVGLDTVGGWIVINTTDGLAQLAHRGAPIVTLGARAPGLTCPAVFPDNRGGMQAAVRHLVEHGHRRIAFVGNLENADIQQRYEGYTAALAAAGLAPDPQLRIPVPDNSEQSGAAALARLGRGDEACTAVACATDENALGVLSAATAAGRRVPEDLAVVGFDDIVLASGAVPPLSTVRVSLQALGNTAGLLLLDQIGGHETPQGVVQVPTAFIPRRSCGCGAYNQQSGLAAIAAAPDWRVALTEQLVSLVRYPLPIERDADFAALWPGAATLVGGLAAALDGGYAPSAENLFQAWRQAVELTQSLETLLAALRLLEEIGAWQLSARGGDPGARGRLTAFGDGASLELMRARLAPESGFVRSYSALVQQNYTIGIRLLRGAAGEAQRLQWLAGTPFRWGCLALWDGEPNEGVRPRLALAGSYGADPSASTEATAQLSTAPEYFPPPVAPPDEIKAAEPELIAVLPIRSASRSWGVLALAGPIEYLRSSGNYDTLSAIVAQLSAALERDALETALRGAYEQAHALAGTVRELSAPVIPLLPGVLLVPLIGALDERRLQQLMDLLLQRVGAHQAAVILLDVTGVPLVDTQAALALIQIARAARLLGARTILVGIGPEIAQSIVSLGLDLRQIETQASLATALRALHMAR